jgi:hypothetical protein
MPRNCVHWENSEKSDYESWTPTSQNGKCLMGKKVTYLRRKANSECFNPDDMSLINTPEICECTADDYECDIGFFRNKFGACYLASGKDIDFTPPETCDKYYRVRKGYRKVANDVCEGGLIHQDYS